MNDNELAAAGLTVLTPAATLPLDQIDLHSFAKDSLGYYAVPPSVHMRAARARGWLFAIRTASALCYSEEWAAAMTAHYGPTGLHTSRCNADDTPSADAIARFPEIRERMTTAAEKWDACVARAERMERGGHYGAAYARWWAARSA